MYSLHTAQRKRRAGLRRPSAARKPGTPTTPTALDRQKRLSSAAVLRKARRMSSDSTRGSSGANPFHRASPRLQQPPQTAPLNFSGEAVTSSPQGGSKAPGNPFFAQLAKHEKPALLNPAPFGGEIFTTPPVPSLPPPSFHMPSYATVVSGKPAPQGPVPGFIAHSPGSIPLAIQHEEGDVAQTPVQRGSFGPPRPPIGHTRQLAAGPTYQQPSDDPPKMLHLKNLPEHLNNPATLRKHFSKYGQITVLDCKPGKRYATVGFATREAAVKAKRSGRLLSEEPIQIFWHSHPQRQPIQRPEKFPTLSANSQDPSASVYTSSLEQRHPLPPPPYVPPSSLPSRQAHFETGFPDQRSNFHQTEKKQSSAQGGGQRILRQVMERDDEADEEEIKSRKILQPSRKRQLGVPLGPVAADTKRQRGEEEGVAAAVGEGLSVTVQGGMGRGKKSVWERLGGRGGEGVEAGGLKTTKGGVRARRTAEDKEWTPQQTEEEGEEEQDEHGGDEGVEEGNDSVLRGVESRDAAEDMDTIARSAAHPYYLRSLHKPEFFAGVRGPKAFLQVPHTLPEEGGPNGSVSDATEPKSHPPLKVDVSLRSYSPLPAPSLPPPPMPRGYSAADLYQSLDTRDEEIRKNSVKQTSLTTAEVVVGTCPDMCPEKERYMREDRRRLSWFELHPNTEPGVPRVDHQRALKEYNRSAADKAEDLPHELRPEPVLLMAMDYLVTSVMDAGDGKVDLWYDFVWNRTRAIRKDITLQHLCSEGCVELTEKCARFHILCAYLLCEEEISVFDQKMNHENLTKCLITLKQFYRDLRIEQNILCPNEAEFCSYDILLHLHDGNVLNIVEQYSEAVRQSPAVRYAVDIALAYSSNNYTKFFKLVRSRVCSFLCACIIHRYFIEIRTTALQVMTRAYTHSKPTNFPLTKFTELLGFENEAMATEFCVHFGLSLSKKMIKLSREFSSHPPSPLPLLLSPSLVGTKRVNHCLGEVVNGGPLPPPPKLPHPHDSFAPGTPLAPPTPVQTRPPTLAYSDQELGVAIELVLEEVTNEEVPPVAMEMLRKEQDEAARQASMCDFCERVMSEGVREECADVAMATLSNAQQEWQLRDKVRVLEEVGKVIAVEMEMSLVAEQVSQIGMQVLRESHEEFVSVVMSICDEVVWDGVRCVSGEVSEEVVREEETERQQKLEKLEKQVLRKRQQRYWKRWHQSFKTRQHTRECVSSIPSLPPLLSLSAQLADEYSLGRRIRTNEGSLESEGGQILELLERERSNLEEKRKLFFAPLNLPALLHDSLLITRPPSLPHLSQSHFTTHHLYWSLAMLHTSSPGIENVKLMEYLEQKLKFCPKSLGIPTETKCLAGLGGTKSSGGKKISVPGVKEISVSSTPLDGSRDNKQLKIVVKSLEIGRFNQLLLSGVCAVIFLAPTPCVHQSPEVYRDDVIQRLMSVTREGWWAETHVPMLVLAPFHAEEVWLAHWNVLRIALRSLSLKPSVFFSDVTFSALQTDSHTPQEEEEVCKGLKWLADHTPSQPPLSCISLRDFIEEGVRQHFIPLMTRDAETRKNNSLRCQLPDKLVALYNAVIAHLAGVASSGRLREISWPVHEFAPRQFGTALAPDQFNSEGLPMMAWNDDHYLTELRERVMQYQLPEFDELDSTGGAAWTDQCRACLQYLEEFVGLTHRPLMPRVKALLHSYSSHTTSDQSDPMFPWDHVITTCIDHLVSVAPTDMWVTCFHGNLKDFVIPTSWMMAEASTSLECISSMTFDPQSPRPKRHRRNLSDSYLLSPHPLTSHIPSPVTQSQLPLATKLAENIETEKQLSLDFEKQLGRLLSDSEVCPAPSPLPPLTPSPPHTGLASQWAGSLEHGLQLLKMKIRTSRFQDKVDSQHLQRLILSHDSIST